MIFLLLFSRRRLIQRMYELEMKEHMKQPQEPIGHRVGEKVLFSFVNCVF